MKLRILFISALIALFLLFYLAVGMPFMDSLIPVALFGSIILLIREREIDDERKYRSERRDD